MWGARLYMPFRVMRTLEVTARMAQNAGKIQ